MKNILLIGMPGTGKSTVGVILAKRLGYAFLDEDILICQNSGATLPQIIEERGVAGFLKLEERVGLGIHCARTVISTGGSVVLSEAAMAHLKQNAVTVWLETPLEVLEERLQRHSRRDRGVAAPDDVTLSEIYAQRAPLYEKYADIRIFCDGNTDSVVRAVREALPAFL